MAWPSRRWAKGKLPAPCSRGRSAGRNCGKRKPLYCRGGGDVLHWNGHRAGRVFLSGFKYENAADARVKNEQVQTQAQALDTDWSAIESAGAADRMQISNILSLEQYRELWKNLLKDLNGAVPKPQDAVAQGLQQGKPELIKTIPVKSAI